jgi:hypothetical protein
MEPEEPYEDGFGDQDDVDEGDGEPFLDMCDQCGGVLLKELYEGDDPLLRPVPDPSTIYWDNPERDGTRMVMVCSAGCLWKIEERFRRRPFVRQELWAGKIVRAIMIHQRELRPWELERETGLEPRRSLSSRPPQPPGQGRRGWRLRASQPRLSRRSVPRRRSVLRRRGSAGSGQVVHYPR